MIGQTFKSPALARKESINTVKTTINSELKSLERKMTIRSNLMRKQSTITSNTLIGSRLRSYKKLDAQSIGSPTPDTNKNKANLLSTENLNIEKRGSV